MRILAYIFFVAALLAVAFAVISGVCACSYAVLSASLILTTRQMPDDGAQVFTVFGSFFGNGLITALACAIVSGSLALAARRNATCSKG